LTLGVSLDGAVSHFACPGVTEKLYARTILAWRQDMTLQIDKVGSMVKSVLNENRAIVTRGSYLPRQSIVLPLISGSRISALAADHPREHLYRDRDRHACGHAKLPKDGGLQ
jgi:hypothetical protein